MSRNLTKENSVLPEDEDRLIDLLRQRTAHELFRDKPAYAVLQELSMILTTLIDRRDTIARGDDPDED